MQKDGSAHKDDTQNRLVHNNTNPSTWAASSTSVWIAPGHKHSVNDHKRRETVGNQVSPLVDGQDGTLEVHPFDLDEVDRIDMLEMRNLAEWDYPIFTLSDVVPSTILSMVSVDCALCFACRVLSAVVMTCLVIMQVQL